MGHSHLQNARNGLDTPIARVRRASGYKTVVDPTGIIHVVPDRRPRLTIPFAPLLALAFLLVGFKALAMVNIGASDYEKKLTTLSDGTFVEQGAAWVLAPDPATKWVYTTLKSSL